MQESIQKVLQLHKENAFVPKALLSIMPAVNGLKLANAFIANWLQIEWVSRDGYEFKVAIVSQYWTIFIF